MNTQADYLRQLGVTLWLPRRPIDGAAQSPAWVYRFVHPAQTLDQVDQDHAESPVPPTDRSGHSLSEQHAEHRAMAHISEALVVPDQTSDKEEKPVAVAATPRVPQQIPRFRFSVTRTPRFLIVDELPTQGGQLLGDAYKRLLAGVVRALGEDPQKMSLPVLLQWPQLAGSKLNQSGPEAVKYVQRTLTSMQSRSEAEHLLLLGAGTLPWVLGELDSEPETGVLLSRTNSESSYLVTQTLSQALQLPDIKRQIWCDLQPVVRS